MEGEPAAGGMVMTSAAGRMPGSRWGTALLLCSGTH